MGKIELNGAKNIRDFGGIRNREGKTIKPHMFIRSGALDGLTPEDTDKLTAEYRIGTVIDLRTGQERRERQDVILPGVEYCHIPIFDEKTIGLSHEKETDEAETSGGPIPELSKLYRVMIGDENAVAQFKKVFEVILNTEGKAVLWHCTEGKDRCGLTSALFLYLLGVDMDTIFADYLKTNETAAARARKYSMLVLLKTHDWKKARSVRRLIIADRHYLEAAFDEIEKLYGGLDEFVEVKLGISKDDINRFRSRCLE